ncbi:hypothetical protein ACFQ36_02995 [Arthrobacter sp. GCM10027362]|uniref:hypothetical protein n=1 Tax=Arthrobacter sp. GCM10027362 TaxID=3273379 RepID=UPI00364204EA
MAGATGREEPSGNEEHPAASHHEGIWPDEAMIRPPIEILGDESLAAPTETVRPAPNRFTHELIGDEPYGFVAAQERTGYIPAGTRVVLMRVDGDRCWVVDGDGRQVLVPASSLRKLPEAGTGS